MLLMMMMMIMMVMLMMMITKKVDDHKDDEQLYPSLIPTKVYEKKIMVVLQTEAQVSNPKQILSSTFATLYPGENGYMAIAGLIMKILYENHKSKRWMIR